MRRFIFWALFLPFCPVFCVITISTTGPVLAKVPHTVEWTRNEEDLEVLRIFKQRPNKVDSEPVAVVDTHSQINGRVNISFDGPAKIRQLVIKDLHDVIIAQTPIFSVLNADGTTGDSQDATSTTGTNSVRNTSPSRPANPLENPAVLGSVIAAGAVITIILIMLLFFYWRLRRKRKREAFLRTQINGYGYESSGARFSDFQDVTPVDPPPQRPQRPNDPEDDLYHFPSSDVPLQSASTRWSMNSAAGRVHTHQASLTLISPMRSPGSSLPSSYPGRRDPLLQESPTTMSPATSYNSYNSTTSLLQNVPERFVGYLPPQESPTLTSPATSYAQSPVLLHPPERSGSMDSKRYLAYIESQRERAGTERAVRPSNPQRHLRENPDEWRSSWQEVSDPPPSYPGHSGSNL